MTGPKPLADALIELAVLIQRRYTQICASHDLTPVQGQLLCTLKDGPQRMTTLAASLGMAKNALSQLVDRTERRGLVSRETPERDRRVITLNLTARGEQIAESLYADVGRDLPDVVHNLSSEDRKALHAAAITIVNEARSTLTGPAAGCDESC